MRCAACIGIAFTLSSGAARAESVTPLPAASQPDARASMPTPFDGLGADLAGAFTGTNLLWYGGAVAATGVMALSGADHAIRAGVQHNLFAPAYANSALYAGYVLPATIAPAIYLAGLAIHDPIAAGAGSAVLQAVGITLVATGVFKIATGRPYPLHGGDPTPLIASIIPNTRASFVHFKPSGRFPRCPPGTRPR